jgi:hypothetical protein
MPVRAFLEMTHCFAKTGCGDFDGNPKRERGFLRNSFSRLRFGLPLTAKRRCPAK